MGVLGARLVERGAYWRAPGHRCYGAVGARGCANSRLIDQHHRPARPEYPPPATGARPVGRAALASEGFAVAIVDGVIAVVIILSIGFAGFFILRGRSASSNKILEDLAGRVENVERRMTDTQEVMIALSEKYDLLEVRYQNLVQGEEEV